MEQDGDRDEFSHHMEMADLHSKCASHHLSKMGEMHNAKHGSGEREEMDESDVSTPKAFAGKETAAEEELEGHKPPPKRRR